MTAPLRVCNQPHELALDFEEITRHEKRTLWVVILTTLMMVLEIVAGYTTGSMALLADGYHMASHAGALGIAYFVYRLARSPAISSRLNFGTGKLLPLGGYTSAVGLGIIALWMMLESAERLWHPVAIEFTEAIGVAVLGLVVNIASAAILGFHSHGSTGDAHHHHAHDHDHDHDHGHGRDPHHSHAQNVHVHDHNHKSALIHVLSDALTSVLAIIALLVGKVYGAAWLDPIMGVIGALVILRWAFVLCRATARELLDAYPRDLALEEVQKKIEDDGHKVLDLHAWRSGPSNLVCILSVESKMTREEVDFRAYFDGVAKGVHLIVERRANAN